MTKFTSKLQCAYLGSQTMRVTSNSMLLAGIVIGLDIVELWSCDDEDGIPRCTYVYASDETLLKYPDTIYGHYPNHKKEHTFSPNVSCL